jgi:hypothetical protein
MSDALSPDEELKEDVDLKNPLIKVSAEKLLKADKESLVNMILNMRFSEPARPQGKLQQMAP